MKNRTIGALAVVVLFALGAAAQQLGPPKLEPTASTDGQKQLIREGVALHDKGDYDGAITRYEQVLKENPNNILALYEMSYSYYAKKDYQKSIDIGFKAAQYKSNLLDGIYMQMGSCFDELGDSSKAIDTYKAGLRLNPSSPLLHYNLAVTYGRTEHFDEARAAAKQAAILNPNHASSQHLLSVTFDRGGYKIPALLAASRFLILEPATKRSDAALQLTRKIMQAGVSPAKDGKNISVLVDTGQKKDEGDFESFDLFMGLMKAADYTEKKKDKSEIQHLVGNFNSLFALLSESTSKSDRSKFTWKYYVPYFVEMKKQGHIEAFAYYINQRSTTAEVGEWLKQNQNKVSDFLSWSKSYGWPKTD